jgi:hypothetical protein
MVASALLVTALGGGWNVSDLRSVDGNGGKTPRLQSPTETKPILGERVDSDPP